MFRDLDLMYPEMREAVLELAAAEVVKGYPDGYFRFENNVTRGEHAIMVDRAIQWPMLAADNYRDVSVHIFLSDGSSTGSGWWIAPQDILTVRHVPCYQQGTEWGCRDYQILMRGIAGPIRSDPLGPRPHVIWTTPTVDPYDIAVIRVPIELWEKYQALRMSQGRGPQPFLQLPPMEWTPRHGEAVVAFGSPIAWEATITTGILANMSVDHYVANGISSRHYGVSAGINPGNSGGLVCTLNRTPIGMADLKPWIQSAFGWSQADDLGMVVTHQEILRWFQRRNLYIL